jgi:hypothetical protein
MYSIVYTTMYSIVYTTMYSIAQAKHSLVKTFTANDSRCQRQMDMNILS